MPLIFEELSEREIEILRLIATGASNKEVAQQLNISVNTVKVHARNIFAKINAASRTEAAIFALRHGLVNAVPEALVKNEDALEENLLGSDAQENELSKADPLAAGATTFEEAAQEQTSKSPQRLYRLLVAAALVIVIIAIGSYAFTAGSRFQPTAAPSPAQSEGKEQVTWKTLKNMPDARAGMGVALYNQMVYLIGGRTAAGVTGAVERYDPQNDAWEAQSPKPTPVGDVKAVLLQGKIYVPGGKTASGAPTGALEIYDPAADRWTAGASLPKALYGYALATLEGNLYIFGGSDGINTVGEVWMYDPAEDRWEQKAAMPSARMNAAAVTVGAEIYVMGGQAGDRALTLNEVYSPNLDGSGQSPWRPAASLPAGRYKSTAVNLVETIFLVGGAGSGAEGMPVLNFSPGSNEWQEAQAPPMGKWSNMGVVGIGPRLYLFGGEIDGSISNQSLSYQAIYLILLPLSP